MIKRLLCIAVAVSAFLTFAVPNGLANEETRSSLTETSKEYLGIPYKLGGTSSAGFDCSGFVLYIFKKYNIALPRTSSDQAKAGVAVEKDDLLPGDIVYFKQTPKARVSHSGIYIGDNQIISSTNSHGIKIDTLDSKSYWGKRYAGARRVIKEDTSE